MSDDQYRISEFKKALRQYSGDGVVDLDKNYPHKFNVQIHRFEDVLRNSRMSAPPNRWSYHRIGFLKEGEGEVISGIYKFRAKKNTLVITPSRVITSSKDWSFDTKGYVLLFNLDFFQENNFSHQFIANRKILNTPGQPYVYLTDDQAEEMTRIFETILLEKKSREIINNELIAVKILELLILSEGLFEEVYGLTSNLPNTDLIRKFSELLDEHFVKEHSVRFYAECMSMHPNQLNALIKKHTGLSAKETIQNKLLLEIKYLLHSTGLSINQISRQLGFSDPNYFGTFFKRSENLSPSNYRSAFG
jgi:AraC family transcriptional activator of pobA